MNINNDNSRNSKPLSSSEKQDSGKDLDVRLGEVLREAGLITPEFLERLIRKTRTTGEQFMEILQQEASLDSLRTLLTAELPLPFSSQEKEEMKKILLESGVITDKELSIAIAGEPVSDKEMKLFLHRNTPLSAGQIHDAFEEKEKTGLPLWQIILNRNLLNHEQITELLRSRMGIGTTQAREDFLIDVLLNSSLLRQWQLDKAKTLQEEKGGGLINHLIESGVLSVEKVASALENVLDIRFLDLTQSPVDPDAAIMIPMHLIKQKEIIPIKLEADRLLLGMLNPLDQEIIHRIHLLTGLSVEPCLIRRKDWEKVVSGMSESRHRDKSENMIQKVLKAGETVSNIDVKDIPAVQLVSSILEGAVKTGSTDIHFDPQIKTIRIRYRIDGTLHDVMDVPKTMEQPVYYRLKYLAGLDITEKRRPQDGHFSIRMSGREFNCRMATICAHFGEKITLRFIDEANVIKGIKQLGFHRDDFIRFQRLLEKPYGLVIATGPMGCGKTTTLYAALNCTNTLNRNVITLEDPIEYRLPGINQIPVNPEIGVDYNRGLRAILRHDSDTIMVGEIRDRETAHVTVRAALTGHLVFCTLHTNDAAGAVTMLRTLGVDDFMIASSLIGVVAQRLVRLVCSKCRRTIQPGKALLNRLKLTEAPSGPLYTHSGCDHCFNTGYRGRTGVFEVMEINEPIRRLIGEGKPDYELKSVAVENGMRTLWENGRSNVLQGVTTPEELFREIGG